MRKRGIPLNTETLVTMASIVYGGWLLMPWVTFQTSGIYSVMSRIAPEELWGVAILLSGLWMLVAQKQGSVRLRTVAAVWAAMLWGTLAVVFLLGNPSGTGVPLVSVYAAFSAANVYRIVRGHE